MYSLKTLFHDGPPQEDSLDGRNVLMMGDHKLADKDVDGSQENILLWDLETESLILSIAARQEYPPVIAYEAKHSKDAPQPKKGTPTIVLSTDSTIKLQRLQWSALPGEDGSWSIDARDNRSINQPDAKKPLGNMQTLKPNMMAFSPTQDKFLFTIWHAAGIREQWENVF